MREACSFLSLPSPRGIFLLQANLRRAYCQFNEEMLESCAKQAEYRSIIFALCYYHAALLERKKFGVGNIPGATSGGFRVWGQG